MKDNDNNESKEIFSLSYVLVGTSGLHALIYYQSYIMKYANILLYNEIG